MEHYIIYHPNHEWNDHLVSTYICVDVIKLLEIRGLRGEMDTELTGQASASSSSNDHLRRPREWNIDFTDLSLKTHHRYVQVSKSFFVVKIQFNHP